MLSGFFERCLVFKDIFADLSKRFAFEQELVDNKKSFADVAIRGWVVEVREENW